MINMFLKAKHWQIFSLIIVIPITFQFIFILKVFANVSAENEQGFEAMFSYFKYFPLIMIVVLGTLYGWMWSVGVGIADFMPEELKMNTFWFKVSLIFPAFYMLFFSYFVINIFMQATAGQGEPPNFSIFGLLFPMHLISMVCSIYALYFVAKTIKMAELRRRVQFGEFVGEFFLLWFFFIGVWILQPKINQMADEQSDIV